ncbi:MAG: alpha/beta hydrolase [Nocardioidaceae bacterium]
MVADVLEITGRIDLVHGNDSRDGVAEHRADLAFLRVGVTPRATSAGALTRRTTLTAIAAGLLAACGSPVPGPAEGTPRPVRHRYGSGPQQIGDLYLPRRGRPRGTVVVIHGGFWQSAYALDLGAATSADLAQRGWAAWNIEYRRTGDGGTWPNTLVDVASAVDHLARLDGVPTTGVITLGHSAGGQLAAWAASRNAASPGGAPRVRVAATVAPAAVLALAAAARDGLGGTAVPGLVGGMPSRLPGRYAEADPLERLPLGVPIRCVHGTDDSTVPISQSTTYVEAARRAGDDAELVRVPGDHFALIDPSTPAWRRTVAVLGQLGGR